MTITSYPNTARLVNRFKLGADPEYVMHDAWGRYVHAETLGMTTLQGFGCDMAGRQVEIRAFPSRFALEVVASILDSLRWIGSAYPASLENNWNAVAYNGKDGCGGHVHFGRRRPNRAKDILVLDRVHRYLVQSGIFDEKGTRARQEHSNYGDYTDFRPQAHGYEYRTFPTQLASPWLMYLTLVVSKLAVFKGAILSIENKADILDLLRHFKDRDDDAALALQAIGIHGLPKQTTTDFKRNWGVSLYSKPLPVALERTYFPSMLPPRMETQQDLFDLFVHGKELPVREPFPTWEPFLLPMGIHKVTAQAHTLGHLPDIAMNLLAKVPVQLVRGGSWGIQSGVALPIEAIRAAIGARVVYKQGDKDTPLTIQVHSNAYTSLVDSRRVRSILTNLELFPIVKASKLAGTSWGKWEHLEPFKANKQKAKIGKVVARVTREASIEEVCNF